MHLPPVAFFDRPVLAPLALLLLVVLVAAYTRGLGRRRRSGGSWPAPRAAAFGWATAVLAVASMSGLARFAPGNFTAYACLYIGVGLLAPLLLCLAAPVTLIASGRLLPNPVRRLVRLFTFPVTSFLLMAASVFVLFFTGLLGLTFRNSWAAQAAGIVLVAVGFLFWYPVVGSDPQPWPLSQLRRFLYVLLSFPVWTIAGMALESETRSPVPGLPVGGLHLGAAILWVAGETAALVGVFGVFVQWLRADERQARRHDAEAEAAAARQLALWRATREAAARAAASR